MEEAIGGPRTPTLFSFVPPKLQAVAILGISFLVVMWLSEKLIAHPATLFPASAIALAGLFLEGIELWPVIYFAALIGYFLLGVPTIFLLILPIAQALQAVVGAYLLQQAKIDPLFRRSRHVFLMLIIFALIAFIVPTLTSFANVLSIYLFHASTQISPWSWRYTGTLFCLVVITPFLLRWFAKLRFSRNPVEIFETLVVFAILIGLDFSLLIQHTNTILGIPTIYVLLLPLFWIALRLRPRFVTLAMFITSLFAVSSLYLTPTLSMTTYGVVLFNTEELLIVLTMIFLVTTSLEEDRRLNVNLLKSQMATLENAIARVSSESDAKNSFIAILAHELRNPLAPITSAIDFLKMKDGREPAEIEALVMMEERMQMVRRLLDDLLDISRISEGKVTLKKSRIELQTVIKRAIISTTHHLKERHQALSFKSGKERLYVHGDAARLEQVFSNLLTNASKYSAPGDQIGIELTKVDDHSKIVVIDTGIGISEENLENIFVPFQQLASGTKNKKGLGIGLALVQSFVQMHDGDITAKSKGRGQGSEFIVMLPLLSGDADNAREPKSKARETISPLPGIGMQTKSSFKPLHVLVVDDNDAAAWGIGRLLELKGCQVSYAYDGEQAIDAAEELSPDVILLDIGLPDQDGYETAKTIRARGFHGRLIALTGYSTEDARVRGRDSGFEYFLVKPAGFEDLKRVIPEIA